MKPKYELTVAQGFDQFKRPCSGYNLIEITKGGTGVILERIICFIPSQSDAEKLVKLLNKH